MVFQVHKIGCMWKTPFANPVTYVHCKVLFLDLSLFLSLFLWLRQTSCSAITNVKIPYLILLLYCIYQLALMTLPSTRPAHFIYLWLIAFSFYHEYIQVIVLMLSLLIIPILILVNFYNRHLHGVSLDSPNHATLCTFNFISLTFSLESPTAFLRIFCRILVRSVSAVLVILYERTRYSNYFI